MIDGDYFKTGPGRQQLQRLVVAMEDVARELKRANDGPPSFRLLDRLYEAMCQGERVPADVEKEIRKALHLDAGGDPFPVQRE